MDIDNIFIATSYGSGDVWICLFSELASFWKEF